MNPELEAEVDEIMTDAEARMAGREIARIIDLAMHAEVMGTQSVKALMLAPALAQGDNFLAALLVTTARKATVMAGAILGTSMSTMRQLITADGEGEEAPEVRAHTLVADVAAAGQADMPALAQAMEADMEGWTLLDKGKILVHTFTVCAQLLREVTEAREEMLTNPGHTGDEGDS